MTDFFTVLDEYFGDADSIGDIRATVRNLWFYDFDGIPLRLWNGQGKLTTNDGFEWLGTIAADGSQMHQTPSIQDGRDGTSATYNFTLNIPDLPGVPAGETFEQLKTEQWRVRLRSLWNYQAVFKIGETLRPTTPVIAFKELIMFGSKFSEKVEEDSGKLVKRYRIVINAKDDNYGRSAKPNGTYTDTMQRRRAAELGVALDRGCEFVSALANRTYVVP